MDNPFKYSNTNKRYYTFDYYVKQTFGQKICKIGIDAGFSCPNRDGKVSYGGCLFCSDGARSEKLKDIKNLNEQFEKMKEIMLAKWPNSKLMCYFQAFTNTYASLDELKAIYEPFISKDGVVALDIATRADCLEDEKIEYLASLNKKIPLFIELGLQTSNDETAKLINRGYDFNLFKDIVKKLRAHNINVIVHLISGLPFETKEDNLKTIKDIIPLDIQQIKFHSLFVNKNSRMEKFFLENNLKPLSMEEYIDITISQMELLPPHIVIQRVTGDPVIKNLAFPLWSIKKINVINGIDKEMKRRDTYQGRLYE